MQGNQLPLLSSLSAISVSSSILSKPTDFWLSTVLATSLLSCIAYFLAAFHFFYKQVRSKVFFINMITYVIHV